MIKYVIRKREEFSVSIIDNEDSKKYFGDEFSEIFDDLKDKIINTRMIFKGKYICTLILPDCRIEIYNYKKLLNKYKFISIFLEEAQNYAKEKIKLSALLAAGLVITTIGFNLIRNNKHIDYNSSSVSYIEYSDNNLDELNNNIVIDEEIKMEVNSDQDNISQEENNIKEDLYTESYSYIVDLNEISIGQKSDSAESYIYQHEKEWNYIQKYSLMYGVDPHQILAMILQESYGQHRSSVDSNGAIGISQIQWNVHKGTTVKAYNFLTGKYDTVTIDWQNVTSLEKNIQIGIIIFRNCLEQNEYNNLLAVQSYNFGNGAVEKVVKIYSEYKGISEDSVTKNPSDVGWISYLEYYKGKNYGDINYINNVYRYMIKDTVVNKKLDGSEIVSSYKSAEKIFS